MVDKVEIDVVRNLSDFMKSLDLRRTVFVKNGGVPESEEFDGNDFTATHFLAKVGGKPAATCRMRYFGDFVRLERACVAPEFAHLHLFASVWDFVKNFAEEKGFKTGYCLCEKEYLPHWEKQGFKLIKSATPLKIGQRTLYPVLYRFNPPKDAVQLNSNPEYMVAPEGKWPTSSSVATAAIRKKRIGRD